jgi:hypothetical protein
MSNEEQNGNFAKPVLAPVTIEQISEAKYKFSSSNSHNADIIVIHPADYQRLVQLREYPYFCGNLYLPEVCGLKIIRSFDVKENEWFVC